VGRNRSRGFTLLELLVVTGLLVAVAGGVLFALDGSAETAELAVAQHELTRLQEAVQRFRLDTGYLPRRGPFALVSDGGRIDPTIGSHWPVVAPSAAAEREAWFRSPANFYQLFEPSRSPSIQVALDVVAGPGRVYNPATRRGYRGPYLSRQSEGLVLVGESIDPDGSGDPGGGSLVRVPGVADPFPLSAPDGMAFHWTRAMLASELPGRPYLLFVLSDNLGPRIVSFGPNGTYESDHQAIAGDDLAVSLGN
jgi:prepilin-type N-terminal cleavage/methylation domain-containing protein